MDIPICRGDLMHCTDILDALTRDFFARKGNPIEEPVEVTEVTVPTDRPGYDPVSSTLWRQREEYCARLIQNAWRRHRGNKRGSGSDGEGCSGSDVGHPRPDREPSSQQTSVLIESDGFLTKNGHKVVIHSRSSSVSSRSTDV